MSDTWFRDGHLYVLVRNGMPEHPVRIGVGDDYAEAIESLVSTPLQSTGRDGGIRAALEWAKGAGWIDDGPDDLENDDGPGDES